MLDMMRLRQQRNLVQMHRLIKLLYTFEPSLYGRSLPFFFRFMNDPLDVGTCRYLPLIESTSYFRLAGNRRPRIIHGGQGSR
jgi:hypothetical protein